MAKTMTDDYMVTMKFQNKSQMFNRTGLTGNILSPLQNFAMTWIGQFREFSKQAPKGTLAPTIGQGLPGTQLPVGIQVFVNILNAIDVGVRSMGIAGEVNKPTTVEKREALKGVSPRMAWGTIEKAFSVPGIPEQMPSGSVSPHTRNEKDWRARQFGTYSLEEVTDRMKHREATVQKEIRIERFKKAGKLAVDNLLDKKDSKQLTSLRE